MNVLICVIIEPDKPAYHRVVQYEGELANSFDVLKKLIGIELADFIDFPPISGKYTCMVDEEGILNGKAINLLGIAGTVAVLRRDDNPDCGYVGLSKEETIEIMSKINRHFSADVLDGNRRA